MSDLISRQDVIDAVTKYCTKYDLRKLLADIEVLPSVEQAQTTLDDVSNAYENGYKQGKFETQQWIPCSERLPNGGHNMLICRKDGTVGEGCYHSIIGEWSQFRWNVSGVKDVIAWMPLPAPYKGE